MEKQNQRIAIVTGANRGIGLEICRQLSREGIYVILTSRDETKGQAAREELAADGLEVGTHLLDVTDPASVRRLADFVRLEHGGLDILVNNAGIGIDDQASLLDVDLEVIRRTLDTNLYGPLLLCQALMPSMKERGYGRIVNLSSGMGQLSEMGSGSPAYRLSKTALNALTAILAAELQGTNVLVNAMCPGWVRTDMGGPDAPRSVEQGADTALWLATLPDGGPQGGYFRDREAIAW